MTEPKKTRRSSVTDETKVKYAIDFIEELSWLLDSKKKLKLNEIPDILRSQMLTDSFVLSAADKYASPNPNIHYLIGVLPRLFQDTKLFPKNEDIASFAKDVLGIEVARVEKRSKYELIGLVVCECNELNDSKLEDMVNALSAITTSTEKISKFAEAKKLTGFSWNEAIRKLSE
ncbi:hypothetical protein K7H09_21900 [Halomonas sp. IOP_14]|uniref:hypothetical protein n=1 Tax=Halomonas sp. IOP_14 TaxID=2873295 RepID=UPI001E6302F8|nr:hypothetical protein [Halomonas sp. IOP_14]MCD1588664.1 hypothetical protein [Halomonas sp. IOP_14]|tara:strand:+ start:438 stop:959 length:522 start_codon:yes stop_codon:yes gene_type:complete